MNLKKTFRECGMSLVEVLIVVAILALVITGALSIYSSAQKFITKKDVQSNLLKDSRTVIGFFIKDAKEAVEVMPGPVIIENRSFYTSETCVIFKMASIDANGIIIDIETNFDYIVYCLNAENQTIMERMTKGKFEISSRVDGKRVLLQNLDSLLFTFGDSEGLGVSSYLDAAIINLSFTLKETGAGRIYQEFFKTSTTLRNKVDSQ
ncbi:MAG: type II secretion system GspH family protein [Candidatus Aminicenantes bacterium]|nr:type II secretion system GspH family protein [Candidatus Aminicenantes bacterium]